MLFADQNQRLDDMAVFSFRVLYKYLHITVTYGRYSTCVYLVTVRACTVLVLYWLRSVQFPDMVLICNTEVQKESLHCWEVYSYSCKNKMLTMMRRRNKTAYYVE